LHHSVPMTSIIPANQQELHPGASTPADPVVWLAGPTRPQAVLAQQIAEDLRWPSWKPDKILQPFELGKALREFTATHGDHALLIVSPGLSLQPEDARSLAAVASQFDEPVVITVLSNGLTALNPFAGLGVADWLRAGGRTGDQACRRLAGLVRILGNGSLHALDRWPSHLLYLTPRAIAILAGEDVTEETALAHLRRQGGRLVACDSIFAADTGRPFDLGPELQPHEERRPAPWGDLTARLEHWIASGASLPDTATCPEHPASLHITHSWGGGVAQWVESYIAADNRSRSFQLRSEGPQSGLGAGQRLSLYAGNELSAPVASWWLHPPIRSSDASNAQYLEILRDIRRRHGIGRIIVSSLVGHSLDALRTGLPTIQVLHDFYPCWPLLGVHPGPFLDIARKERLQQALQQHELLSDFSGIGAPEWNALADDWLTSVSRHPVGLAAPSDSVAGMLRKLDKRWQDLEIRFIPHGLAPFPSTGPVSPRPRADGKLRLVIPGRMQQGKGQSLLLEALPELTRHAQVYLLGAGKQAEVFFGKAGVNVILQYRREELPQLMRAIGPDVAGLLSIVPETFSYTLSEMQLLGIPVIATRVGSLAERIHDGQDGWLIEPDASDLAGLVRRLAADRKPLDRVRDTLRRIEHFSAADMVRRYNDTWPALGLEPDIAREPGLPDIQQAALAEQHARLQAIHENEKRRLKKLQAEIEQRTEWAMEREEALFQEQLLRERWVQRLEEALEAEQEQRDRWVRSLERDIRAEQEAHRNTLRVLNDQYDAILRSSSWRITRPMRATRRVVDNLARARAWNPARWPLLISQAVRTVSTLGLGGALLRLQESPQLTMAAPVAQFEQNSQPIGDPDAPQRVPRAERPRVSIIIPVYNKWQYTAACLRSVAQARNDAGFEVIVVDDGSGDETPGRLADVEGIEFIQNPQNLGFVDSCNRGVEAARGDYVVLLNNDTQVLDGWLDALLETFERFPDTGLAGARLVYPDGRLQEAGGIVFRDGSGWNYGRGDRADDPGYAYTREVDYCSGACVMIPAKLFRMLGGFDPRYAPAYYEDTDLAFRVREAGFKVRLQAAVTVIHHEGATSGTDTASGAKRFQNINREKFCERWREPLADYPEPITDPEDLSSVRRARDHRLLGRVLIIDAYTPEPDQDSGSLRLRYLFDCFRQLGYGVSFFADNRGYAGHYSAELQKSGVEVLYNPWIESLQDFFRERGNEFDFIMISRHYVAANYLSLIQRYCPQAKFIFDTVDLHYLREQRLAALENSLPLKRVAAQTRRSELAVISHAAATLVVSEVEKAVLAEDAPKARVFVLSNIHRVCARQGGFSSRKGIVFIGGYQHPPNIDAAHWFVESIWPLIRQKLPDIQFHLIGSKAPDRIRALHGNGVEFHGFVKDLKPWLDGCRVAVAPLRYGAGVKGKVNLSMSRGQPVVATTMAVEGLHAQTGRDVLVADSAEDFAAAVVRLYGDEALWNRLSLAGQENVRRHFSEDSARDNLKKILDALKVT